MVPPPEIVLTELELDALSEIANIGVSRAAAGLAQMVQQEILLSVPSVEVVTRQRAAKIVNEHESGDLVAVEQSFTGDLSGRALLLFPQKNSFELVRAVVGGELALEDVIALEHEALAETGNVVLNGCLASFANLLHRTLQVSLPGVRHGSGAELLQATKTEYLDDAALLLYIHFRLSRQDIRGYIAFLMDLPALTSLKELLRELVERTASDA
jgi:chemotaxis protein CheC